MTGLTDGVTYTFQVQATTDTLGLIATTSGDRVRDPPGNRLPAQPGPEGARHGEGIPALGDRHHGDHGRPAAQAAVGAPDLRLLGRPPGPGRETQADLQYATRADPPSRRLGRHAPGGGHGLRRPGGLQPPAGAARRLGVAAALGARAAAPAADVRSRCDPRYPAFIDHLVAGRGAEAMLVPGSFRELPRHGRHPDHCAVSAAFRF